MSTDAPSPTTEPVVTVDPASLPDDLKTCHRLILDLLEVIRKDSRNIEQLKHQLAALLRARYGKKSEKLDPNQLLLFAEQLLEEGIEPPQPEPEPKPQKERKPRSTTGRRPLGKHLPRVRIEHDLSAEQKICSCCGAERIKIGEEVSEQLDYIPAMLRVLEQVRFKYACKHCQENVTTAPKPPQPIEKGLPTPGLLAYVITSKYADHLPLYRLEGIFTRHGADISRKTLCGWMADCANLLTVVYFLMAKRIKQSRVIHTDATSLPVQAPIKTKKAYLSPYIGDANHPYTVFDFTEDYKRDGPMKFLEGYSGYLQADAHSTYDELYKAGLIIEVACWSHCRRKFFDAKGSDPTRAHVALAMIGELYQVEREATEYLNRAIAQAILSGGDVFAAREAAYAHRHALRQQRSVKLLDQIKAWLDKEAKDVLPKSPIGQAIAYALNHWTALCKYTEKGYLAIDNNIAERAIKNVVIGRKGWLFAGSDAGGQTAAILFTLTVTCKTLGVDPFAYLRDLLTKLPVLAAEVNDPEKPRDHPGLADLLPDRWKALHTPATPAT